MRGIIAYIKKSFLIAMRYKFNIFMEYVSPLLLLLILYIVYNAPFKNSGHIIINIDNSTIPYIKYLTSGILFSIFQFRILYMFCKEMEYNKIAGYLEMLIVSSTSFTNIIIAMFTWRSFFNFMVTLPYLIIGLYCIKGYLMITFSKMLLMILVLLLSFVIFCCLALFMAGLVLILDKGLRFVVFFNQALRIIGGIFIPVHLLPKALRIIAEGSPIYIYIKSLRGIVFNNYSLVDIAPDIGKLLIFIAIMCPISIIFLKLCLKKRMIEGTLERY